MRKLRFHRHEVWVKELRPTFQHSILWSLAFPKKTPLA